MVSLTKKLRLNTFNNEQYDLANGSLQFVWNLSNPRRQQIKGKENVFNIRTLLMVMIVHDRPNANLCGFNFVFCSFISKKTPKKIN